MKKIAVFFLFFIFCCSILNAENMTGNRDTNKVSKQTGKVRKKELSSEDIFNSKIKKGWTFAVFPGISYNADNGMMIGLAGNVYNYGNGSNFPDYRHSVFAQVLYTSKKSWIIRFRYDSDFAIPKTNLFVDVTYIPSKSLDFYGFNGRQSIYHHEWETAALPETYLTRVFYRRQSDMFRSLVSFRGTIGEYLKWQAAVGVLGFIESVVNLESFDNSLPANQTDLYRLYQEWGLIKEAEAHGGWHPYLNIGLVYDSRNRKINPSKGFFIDCFMTYNAAFGNLSDYNNLKLNLDFMHFVNLKADRLILAYRISTQNTIAGKSPYYLNNYQNELFIERNQYYGLGGMTSLRGILQSRVWVPGYAYLNLELRGRIVDFRIKRQHFYLGANAFVDAGMATQLVKYNEAELRYNVQSQLDDPNSWISLNNKKFEDFFDLSANSYVPHFGAGLGLKLAMNENFVLSMDWAVPFSRQDNYTLANFYLVFGYQF